MASVALEYARQGVTTVEEVLFLAESVEDNIWMQFRYRARDKQGQLQTVPWKLVTSAVRQTHY